MRHYEQEQILKSILKHRKIDADYLGDGNYAVAYLSDNKVYKVTSDQDDALQALTIKNYGETKYFAQVHEVSVINKGEYFLIVTEFIQNRFGLGKPSLDTVNQLLNSKDFFNEQIKLGFLSVDTNPLNFGCDKNNQIKLFDFGHRSSSLLLENHIHRFNTIKI